MRVRELVKGKGSGAITVSPDTDLGTAARLLMQHNIGGLPVVRADGTLVGLLAERDLVRAVDRSSTSIRHVPVERFMRVPPTCAGDDTLREVMARMTRDRLRHLVVVDDGRISGVLSVGDLVKQRFEELQTEAGVLRDYVAAGRAIR
jgi:CBS domain-containing protein